MPTLVEKLGKFAGYELGFPMVRRMSQNHMQARFNLEDRKYLEALKSAGKTLFYTAQEGIWLASSFLEAGALTNIVNSLYLGDLKRTAVDAGAIVLLELVKDIMNNPQRYCIYRPRRNISGTPS